MRTLIILLMGTLFFTSAAFAGGKKAAKTVEGRIVKFEKARVTVEITNPNGTNSHQMIYMDDKIQITLDGKPATLNDLAQRMHVVVTMRNNLIANSIAADSGNDKKPQ